MSDTPRTDAVKVARLESGLQPRMVYTVDADFARQLERELNHEKSRRETDKKRIDWLGSVVEYYGRDIGFHWDHQDGFWFATFDRGACGGIPMDSATKNKSVRAAIDAAMKEVKP